MSDNQCPPYYLAIDIGASSGRHLIGWLQEGKIHLQEVYRFSNGPVKKDQHLVWDHQKLFQEIIHGLKACKAAGYTPTSMGIDTWGVDFALLDQKGSLLGDTVSYRDHRTQGFSELVNQEMLYSRTGIYPQPFNTLYQLIALRKEDPTLFAKGHRLLLMPEYLHFLLTGKIAAEYTNATTTGLVNATTRTWDKKILNQLSFPEHLFPPIQYPGTLVGTVRKEIAQEIGFSPLVVLPPTHDTASAVAAAPLTAESLFLSSGTWSLIGAETSSPNTSMESLHYGLTNEGGVNHTYRHLKNIMGLWILQCLKKEEADPHLTYG
ncbi:MAG: rhamnulokinase, partial [Clostridiales bacterium]|nr:rhamnulokinase [Clostridiales bacterium]